VSSPEFHSSLKWRFSCARLVIFNLASKSLFVVSSLLSGRVSSSLSLLSVSKSSSLFNNRPVCAWSFSLVPKCDQKVGYLFWINWFALMMSFLKKIKFLDRIFQWFIYKNFFFRFLNEKISKNFDLTENIKKKLNSKFMIHFFRTEHRIYIQSVDSY